MGLFGLIMLPGGIVLTLSGLWASWEPAVLAGLALTLAGWLCLR